MVSNSTRRNPERQAWAVLIGALAIFGVLALAVPLGGRWWLLNASAPQAIAMSSSGTVLMVRPGTGRTEANPSTAPLGAVITSQSDSQASLTFTSPDGRDVVASVQLYGNAQLVITQADSPRYRTLGANPHRIKLSLVYGRARAFIGLEVARAIVLELESAPDTVTRLEIPGSNASVEVTGGQSIVTVRDGEASVSHAAEIVTLTRDQRAEVSSDGTLRGPLSAERNLVVNGDFREPLSAGWVEAFGTPVDPSESPGNLAVVASAGQRAVNFVRTGSNWGRVGIAQTINQDIRDFNSLRLHLAVLVLRQDLFNCGQQGTEGPVIVRIVYSDLGGGEKEWLQGFFYNYDPNPAFGPLVCAPCQPPRPDHQQVVQNQWSVYDSSVNLLEVFRQAGSEPVSIKSLEIYGSGHTFNSLVTEVQLLAE